MSFWDNVKDSFKNFTQPYPDDDEYDDYEDEETADGYEEAPAEEEPAPRTARRTSPFGAAASREADFGSASASAASSAASASSGGFSGQVLNMSSGKQEVVLFHAKAFDDAAKAADELRKKRALILNMEGIDKALTRRVVDFLSGTVYALDGKVCKVAQCTYLVCPHSMDILGEAEGVQADTESYV